MKKKISGMNSATRMHFEAGFCPPMYAGKDEALNKNGAIIPPYAKIIAGTPYVNPDNFNM